jgi:hypothetical protein
VRGGSNAYMRDTIGSDLLQSSLLRGSSHNFLIGIAVSVQRLYPVGAILTHDNWIVNFKRVRFSPERDRGLGRICLGHEAA